MSKGIGRLLQVGIARETSRGTAIGTPTYMIAFAELDVDEKDLRAVDEQSRGIVEGSVGESIVKQWMEASLKAPIGDAHFPLILYATLGTLSTVTGTATGTPYYHTITVQQGAQHQSLTLLVDDPLAAQDYKHALSVISGLELAYERETFLSYTANIRGNKGTATTVTAVATTENRFLPQHLSFKVAATQSALDAASATPIKSATLRINQNIVDDDVLGNISPQDFLNKQFEIDGEIEAIWQNESDFKTNSLTGTARAIRLDLVNTGATIGTGSTNPSLRIDLHKVTFQPVTRPIRLNDIVMQRVAFKAHYNTTDSKMVTITATNNQSSY